VAGFEWWVASLHTADDPEEEPWLMNALVDSMNDHRVMAALLKTGIS
jgi:hypothetical protein